MKAVLFIDGDNIPPNYYLQICTQIKNYFPRTLNLSQHLFINSKSPYFKAWQSQIDIQSNMQIHAHHVCEGHSKNSTDIKITIETMKIINLFDTVMIASNDSDFSHLAAALQSHRVYAVGIGLHTHHSYRACWNHFLQLTPLPKEESSLKKLIYIAQQSQHISPKESLQLLNKTFKSPTIFHCKSWKQVCKQYSHLFEYKYGTILPKAITSSSISTFNSHQAMAKENTFEKIFHHYFKNKKWQSAGHYTRFILECYQLSAQELFDFPMNHAGYYQKLLA